jgi:hypothetical protein
MKTVVREVASLVVGLTGLVLFGIGMNQVLGIGSCASGGPYVIENPCPEGTDGVFWMMMGGALGWIVAIIVSPRNFIGPGAGQLLWVLGFAGGGAALLIKVLTDEEMPPDSRLGASIVAAVFIPMGLVVAVVGVVQLTRPRLRKRPAARGATRPAARPDPWTRMKALNDLRSSGALTREEFVALRATPDDPDPAADRVALIRKLADQRAEGALSTAEFEARKRGILAK